MSTDASPTSDFHKDWKVHRKLPYLPNSNALQTFDLYLPPHNAPTDGVWILFIHGGAWRDPRQTSSGFDDIAKCLLTESDASSEKIAGMASLSYSLSKYEPAANDPVKPQPGDESRVARHPQHLLDVLHGIKKLQGEYRFGERYVLCGHSCGATLAFQVLLQESILDGKVVPEVVSPSAIVGLNGLYDLPALVHAPGKGHENLAKAYALFLTSAFGDDENEWQRASPTSATDSPAWQPERVVAIADSEEDSLVPMNQGDRMMSLLDTKSALNHWAVKPIRRKITGDHNHTWEDGRAASVILRNIIDQIQTKV